jgi:hypothetical protein
MSNTDVSYGEYEGKATIALLEGEKSFVNRPFQFGLKKAKLILAKIDKIRDFVENYETYQAGADEIAEARDAEKDKIQLVLSVKQLEQLGNCKTKAQRTALMSEFQKAQVK